MTPDVLADALEKSRNLSALIGAAWESTPAFAAPRDRSAQGLCAVSLHHGVGVHALLLTLPSSAIALVRPQYETLVRAVWASHAASDATLERLLAPLSVESQQAAKKLPGVPEMLAELEASGPHGAAALLGRARANLWDGLNSFVHGGIHPFARQEGGYPVDLLADVLKNSNALSMLTLNVLAGLPKQDGAFPLMQALHREFGEVLPTLEPLTPITQTE
jgi:hypothetical protein